MDCETEIGHFLVPNEETETKVQIYKPKNTVFDYNNRAANELFCGVCRVQLKEPYISCAECKLLSCCNCFCRGAETLNHKNIHSYRVIRDDNISVFPVAADWSGREEKKLLDLLIIHGYGNWESIAKSLRTKSAIECQEHYLNFYFGGVFEKTFGLTGEPYEPDTVPFQYKMTCLDPPRYDIDNVNFKRMAGYRFARSDFDIPYDISAEGVISNISPNDENDCDAEMKEIMDALNCGVFTAYNNRLKERQRRYAIIKEHGLLMASRTLSWLSKHSEALSCVVGGKSTTGRFVACMQLVPAVAFDGIVEALQYATDLKKYIYRLYDLRKNGITTFYGGKLYHKLKAKRLSKIRNKKEFQFENLTDWRNILLATSVLGQNSFTNQPFVIGIPRRKAAPLDILGLPGYDKLTEEERGLCSVVRLSPMSYLDYKHILIQENTKLSCLRLAEARRLIKIDVNKTRQLYDFLIRHGYINKPTI